MGINMIDFRFNLKSRINNLIERYKNIDNWKRKPSGREFDLLMTRLIIVGIALIFMGIYSFIKCYLFYQNEIDLNVLSIEQVAANKYAKADINMSQGPVYEWNQAGEGDGKKCLYIVPIGTDSLNYMFLAVDGGADEKKEIDYLVGETERHMEQYGNLYQMDKKTVRGYIRNLPVSYREKFEDLQVKSGFARNYTPYYIDFGCECDGEKYLWMGKCFMAAAAVVLAVWFLGQKAVSSLVKFIMQ